MGARPFADRLQRREEFGVEQAGGVGAVVGAAMLRHHRFHLGAAADQLAHLVDIGVAGLQRDGRRQGRANPEIALLELGQEFQPEQAAAHDGHDHEPDRARHHQLAVADRPVQHRHVEPMQQRHDPGFGFVHMRRQDDRAQRRRDREGREQAAGQRIGIGPRHRPEDIALDAAQGEQRQERRDDDGGGKEDRARHVGGGATGWHGSSCPSWCRSRCGSARPPTAPWFASAGGRSPPP